MVRGRDFEVRVQGKEGEMEEGMMGKLLHTGSKGNLE